MVVQIVGSTKTLDYPHSTRFRLFVKRSRFAHDLSENDTMDRSHHLV
jgi:hypothetical protein